MIDKSPPRRTGAGLVAEPEGSTLDHIGGVTEMISQA